MSFLSGLSVQPRTLTRAAGALRGIGEDMVASGAEANRVTAAVVAPGGDQVSTEVAACLCAQAADYRRVSDRAAVILEEFAASLSASAEAYSTSETDNSRHVG
ncbi:PE family protein [Mycobacterium haemophilum]